MSKIYHNTTELIGNTPLLELSGIKQAYACPATLLGKMECFNPAGSSKDRVAWNMIRTAEKSGKLKEGSVIIEPTSGNTGIGLASIGSAKGYQVILTMPDTMSGERINLLKAYGAQVVLTPGKLGMTGCIEKAKELAAQYDNSFIPSQFENPANPESHYLTTGPEIWQDTDGKIDIFIAGIGTGGTISGVGRYLKEQNPAIQIIGVEPFDSPLLTKGNAGPHGLQGIGANFIPSVYDASICDEVLTVKTEDAYKTGKAIAAKEGILVGITSGAAVYAALELAKRPENENKTIVSFLPDTGDRYLSTPGYFN